MNKLLILSAMAFFAALMPIVPALACFPDPEAAEDEKVLFASEHQDRSFTRAPIPMSFCDSGEVGFVVVMGKCYDFDAITDYDTEEECQADPVCKAYREQVDRDRPCEEYHVACQNDVVPPSPGLIPEPKPNPPYTCDTSGRCTPIEPGTAPEPTPEPEPEPPQECSHEGLGPDVCRPVEDSEQEDEEVVEEDEEEAARRRGTARRNNDRGNC